MLYQDNVLNSIFFHVIKFENLEIWIVFKSDNFRPDFETRNDFN
jgi:hypothetical protein